MHMDMCVSVHISQTFLWVTTFPPLSVHVNEVGMTLLQILEVARGLDVLVCSLATVQLREGHLL